MSIAENYTDVVPGLEIEEVNGIIELTGCNSDEPEIIIPEQVEYISKGAFEDCEKLERVVIPDSVRSLGWYVFSGCTSLKSVVLPHSLKELPMHTFCDCSSLTDIVIPGNIKTIDAFCFSDCTSLKNVTMQVGVEQIGMNAFEGCESLEEITLPDGFTTLGDKPFENCRNLKKLVVPDTTVNFGYRVFDCDPGIVRLTVYCSKGSCVARYIAESDVSYRLTDLEGDFFVLNGVLQRYFGNDSVVVVPDGVEHISYNAFCDSRGITDVIIPESVKNIIYYWGCGSYFPRSITIHCHESNVEVIRFCQEHDHKYEIIDGDAQAKDGE